MKEDNRKWRKLKRRTKVYELDCYTYKDKLYVNVTCLFVDCGRKNTLIDDIRDRESISKQSIKDSIE